MQICRLAGAGGTRCATEHLCILDWLKVVYSVCDGEFHCVALRVRALRAFIVKPGAKVVRPVAELNFCYLNNSNKPEMNAYRGINYFA